MADELGGSEHVLWMNLVASPIVSNVLKGLVSLRRLPHIISVLAAGGRVVDVVTIVVFNNTIDTISHTLIKFNGILVTLADK